MEKYFDFVFPEEVSFFVLRKKNSDSMCPFLEQEEKQNDSIMARDGERGKNGQDPVHKWAG